MLAAEVIALLKQKHWKDVCVEQCKTRACWTSVPGGNDWEKFAKRVWDSCGHGTPEGLWWSTAWSKAYRSASPIMDMWVLPRSWSNGAPICYEVKVSRSDLFSDHKFPDYWWACKYFYFAVPNGLVSQEEMNRFPPQCGFIEVNGKGTGLRIKRKPCYMSGDIDETVYRYVLMWRAEIKPTRFRELTGSP